MKALVLAGGFGTRLGRLTKNKPKPLIKIGNKTVIEHIVDRLVAQGITQIIVKVHYLPDQIMEVLGNKVMYYFEPVLYTHLETIKNLKSWIDNEDFMVINADTINNIDYQDMISYHKPLHITMLTDEYRCAGTWIYPSTYFLQSDLPIQSYRPKFTWFDIGTPERLKKAREYYGV